MARPSEQSPFQQQHAEPLGPPLQLCNFGKDPIQLCQAVRLAVWGLRSHTTANTPRQWAKLRDPREEPLPYYSVVPPLL